MERKAARFIFQGTDITISVTEDMEKELARFIAFFKALAQKDYGKTCKDMILCSGDQFAIGVISSDKMMEFMQKANDYKLPYYSVFVVEKNAHDVLIKQDCLDDFNNIAEQIGVAEGEMKIRDFTVDNVRGSIKEKLAEMQKKPRNEEISGQQNQLAISQIDADSVRKAVCDINQDQPEAYRSDNWKAYLEAQTMLCDYSEENRESIILQQPDATLVLPENNWINLGRQPVEGAKGINIKMPIIIDGEKTGEYYNAKAFDVSETFGATVDYNKCFTGLNDHELNTVINDFKNQYDTVICHYIADACFDPHDGKIYMREDIPKKELFAAIYREAVFAECFKENPHTGYDWKNHHRISEQEFEGRLKIYFTKRSEIGFNWEDHFRANSVMYALCIKFGVDASYIKNDMFIEPSSRLFEPTQDMLKNDREFVLKNIAGKSRDIQKSIQRAHYLEKGCER